MQVTERTIHKFVSSQQDWVIGAKKKVIAQQQTIKKIAPKQYKDGVTIPFGGEQRVIQLHFQPAESIQVIDESPFIKLYLPERLKNQDLHQTIKDILIQWMQNQAAVKVKQAIDVFTEKYKLYPRSVKIKTQKSRWGSCGIHDDLNLNWLLVLAPTKVLEYVVIHEICHIQERNHSASFWNLVEKYCPDYKIHRLWLKQNGQRIMQGL